VWFSSAPEKRLDVIETALRCATVIRFFDSGRVVYQVREGNQTVQPGVAKRTDLECAVNAGLFLDALNSPAMTMALQDQFWKQCACCISPTVPT
jgi:hypothetical protein